MSDCIFCSLANGEIPTDMSMKTTALRASGMQTRRLRFTC